MADALLSPAVGGVAWAASAATLGYAARRVRREGDDRKVPLMGVLGAFVFAAQMVNFTIPATGSSGHLGGGMILSILLGPHAALLVMASVLTVQALFFADGGLLALGCNIFNLGAFPAFVGLPLYRLAAGRSPSAGRRSLACVLSAVAALQLGALAVVLQTVLSGVSELPFPAFAALMQPIHLAIGMVEGLVTAAVIAFVAKAQPEILAPAAGAAGRPVRPARAVLLSLAAAALLAGGALSWFASPDPDGLEWAVAKVSGKAGLEGKGALHEALALFQEKTAFLPDYGFPGAPVPAGGSGAGRGEGSPAAVPKEGGGPSPAVPPAKEEGATPVPAAGAGTSASGIVGGAIVLALVVAAGVLLRRRGPDA